MRYEEEKVAAIPSTRRRDDCPDEEEPFDEKDSIVSFKHTLGVVITNPAQLKEFSTNT